MKPIVTRSLSGLVYVTVIVAAVLCGQLWFIILAALFTLLGIVELNKNIAAGAQNAADSSGGIGFTFIGWLSTALTALVGACIVALGAADTYTTDCAAFLTLVLLVLTILVLAVFDKSAIALRTAMSNVFGLLYIGLPLLLLARMYAAPGSMVDDGGDSRWIVLAIFILIWVNDTGAYCVGCSIGRNRLCERLSPKKSIEGFVGGVAFCIGASVLLGILLPVELPMSMWIILGIVVGLFATVGDLFESLIKRTMGVKDSGHLIPGHGGILDRIDSLLFVAPAAYFLFAIWRQLM